MCITVISLITLWQSNYERQETYIAHNHIYELEAAKHHCVEIQHR